MIGTPRPIIDWMVAEGGIEPPTRGFSGRFTEVRAFVGMVERGSDSLAIAL